MVNCALIVRGDSEKEANVRNAETGCLATMAEWFTSGIPDAWQRWREQREFAEFADREPVEAGRVAHEMGLTTKELLRISGGGLRWLALLTQRMRRLGLDFDTLNTDQPVIARDLALCCARCDSKLRCAHDLRVSSQNEAWRKYCANGDTFDALLDERR